MVCCVNSTYMIEGINSVYLHLLLTDNNLYYCLCSNVIDNIFINALYSSSVNNLFKPMKGECRITQTCTAKQKHLSFYVFREI